MLASVIDLIYHLFVIDKSDCVLKCRCGLQRQSTTNLVLPSSTGNASNCLDMLLCCYNQRQTILPDFHIMKLCPFNCNSKTLLIISVYNMQKYSMHPLSFYHSNNLAQIYWQLLFPNFFNWRSQGENRTFTDNMSQSY